MDIADQAQILEEVHLSVSLKAVRSSGEQEVQMVEDGKVLCIDCLDEIAPARLEAIPDCVRCVACQQDHERLG